MMLRGILLLALMLTLTACGSSVRDLDQYVADVKSRTFGQLEPLPEIRPYETFTYDAYDLRPPVHALELDHGGAAAQHKRSAP